MEFVGNQLNFKTIIATLSVAFFVGRINFFHGAFPAAVAFIAVMTAVSTVYIYTLPLLIAGMLTYGTAGINFYGDLGALLFCGILFLLLRKRKLTINQRTIIAIIAVVLGNCLYYGTAGILYFFGFRKLVKECIALLIYLRVFNTLAKALFTANRQGTLSAEKMGLAYGIFVISILGAIGGRHSVICLWTVVVLMVQYLEGIYPAMLWICLGTVFWQCRGFPGTLPVVPICIGLLAGWFFSGMCEEKYRKVLLGAVLFLSCVWSGGEYIYEISIGCILFSILPAKKMKGFWSRMESYFLPDGKREMNLRLEKVRTVIQERQHLFYSLGNLYGTSLRSHQLISQQFLGLGRTMDWILKELNEVGELRESERGTPAEIGTSSYAAGKISGDSSLTFSYGEHYQAMIISDGMGTGKAASEESRMVITTLSKLLNAGFAVDLAVRTINSILLSGERGEMFATVDLALIDNRNNHIRLFKMGAAASFIRHNEKVTRVQSPAPPVGIVEGGRVSYVDFRLKKGDSLIMVSDGVTDCDREDSDGGWLMTKLCKIKSHDPETIADLLIRGAAEKYGERERDDLTVMVASF